MRILFVAEVASVHTARWINQLKDTGWDLHVFQGMARDYGVCSELQCGTLHLPYPTAVPAGLVHHVTPTLPINPIARKLLSRTMQSVAQALHVRHLARLIERLKPDLVHSLGLNVNWNNLCLPVLQSRRMLRSGFSAPWIYSSWGSDLDYYARQPGRRAEVEAVLASVDYQVSECERDARLAREMGFKGELIGMMPAYGGVAVPELSALRQPGPPSARGTVLLKGRDHHGGGDPVGRAMTAMRAFALCQDVLEGYEIVIAQASASIAAEAARLSANSDLKISVLGRVPYLDLMRIFGRSRVLLALTINDGLPSTLVEAMALGAFPIHSDLEPIREWLRDGENGALVPAEDVQAVAGALRRALTDGDLVDRADTVNARIVREQLSDVVVRRRAVEMYQTAAMRGPVRPRA